jgi:ATP/maltotriose-dependent transcriptional regulator MalT
VARRRGRFAAADDLYRRAAEIAERCGARKIAATSHFNRAAAAIQRGATGGVDALLESAIRLFELDGFAPGAGHARATFAELLFVRGELCLAEREARRATESLLGLGHSSGLALAQNCLGELLAVEGRLDEAAAVLADARISAERTGDRALQAAVASNQCLVHCLAGRADDASNAAAAALDLVASGREDASEILLRIAMAGFLGLRAEQLRGARAVTGRATGARADGILAVLAGAEAFLDPSAPPDALRTAAAAMRRPELAVRQSVFEPFAEFVDAAAAARAGDADAAREMFRSAGERLRQAGMAGLARVVATEAARLAV